MIMVLVELTLKAEQFDQRDVILSALPDTVAYEGCLGLEACSNREESKLIFVENRRTGNPMVNT
jgi:quinol monooxygenase YgiN|tara:strand:- start:76 stop:267 length:192 start_codon:yes stop_codon:yes gene_type:complete